MAKAKVIDENEVIETTEIDLTDIVVEEVIEGTNEMVITDIVLDDIIPTPEETNLIKTDTHVCTPMVVKNRSRSKIICSVCSKLIVK